MGLDMYLSARKYIGAQYEHRGTKHVSDRIVEAMGGDCPYPVEEVKVQLIYWRKANQIHGWFVDNVQGGKDECQESYVSIEKLRELKVLCDKALSEKISDDLPPRSGFFFGSTEPDEWYWRDVEETRNELTKVLDWLETVNKDHSWDIYYEASW